MIHVHIHRTRDAQYAPGKNPASHRRQGGSGVEWRRSSRGEIEQAPPGQGQKVYSVPLKSVKTTAPVRYANNNPKIDAMRKILREGGSLPPIIINHKLDENDNLEDGYHRFHAHRLEGRSHINALIAR